jgi:DNA-binding SARP family transcriptional activator/predicted ATPase
VPRLSLFLFGPLQVISDGEPVTGFESDKVRALLAYLAVETEAPQRRERLAGLLWPDQPEQSARTNLRHVLASLRKAIGDRARSGDRQATPPFLYISRQTIQFNRTCDAWVDVSAFTDLLRTNQPANQQTVHQLEEAVELYRGNFLAGFSLPGCPAFEEWALFEGERLQRLALEALGRLSDWYQNQGKVERALEYAWRQVELEPWREEAHRQVMRLLAIGGQRSAALAQYETCRRVLVEELGVEPGAETTQLYEQIRDGELETSTVAPALIREPELVARLPSFLTEEAEEVQPPPFVARERELARLDGFLDEALTGDGKVVFVTGGPGRGKTVLLGEFARRAMEVQPDLIVASGNCNANSGIGDPYLPFRDVMGMLTGDVEAKWAAGAISRDHALRLWGVLPLAVQALVDHGPHVVPALVPGAALLSRAMAVAPTGAPWLQQLRERVERQPADSEGLEQSHLFQQVTNLLRALTEAHPLLLILDDLQWADSASIDLLFYLGRRLEGSRILIAGAYRPEEIALGGDGARSADRGRHPLKEALAELKRRFGDVWVDLAEVPELEGRHFVDALLEIEPNRLGEGFRRALFEHAGGHPLFTVELLRAMQERGDLVQDETGRWVPGPALDWETLPPRVEGVIEARVGRLDEELREFLSVASVEGEEFTAQVVAQVQEVSERQALRRLSQELEKRHRLVREQSVLPVGRRRLSRYRFSHALFQQYLYNDLGEGERALLHGEIAGVLEELYQGRIEEVAVQLARHYSKARDESRALEYFTLAGDVALAAYANREAEGHYRRALGLAPVESQRAFLLSGLGQALARQGQFQEAMGTWREGIDLYRALEDSESVARLYARLAGAANQANDLMEYLRLCLEGLAMVRGTPESPGLARLLHETACAYMVNALREEGWPFAQRALEMAERLGDVEVQARALAELGLSFLTGENALEAHAKAVELAESNGLLLVAQRAHHCLGRATIDWLGDYRTGREHLWRGVELARRGGSTVERISILSSVVFHSMVCGEFEEVEMALSRMRRLLTDLTEPTLAAERVLHCEIWYLGIRGEWAECARRARARQATARERGIDRDLADAGIWLAWAVMESRRRGSDAMVGEWEEAEAALVEAIEIYDRSWSPMYGVRARVFLGSLRIYQGRLDDARRLLAEAQEKAILHPAVSLEADVLLLTAQLAGAEGRWAEALAVFEAAAGIHARCGARCSWARWLLDWAEAHVARGEPGDLERAKELFRDSQTAFQEMGIMRYATLAHDRLEALGAVEE